MSDERKETKIYVWGLINRKTKFSCKKIGHILNIQMANPILLEGICPV